MDTARSNGPPYPRTVGTPPLIRSLLRTIQLPILTALGVMRKLCRASPSTNTQHVVVRRARREDVAGSWPESHAYVSRHE